jgi:hypothetical protein
MNIYNTDYRILYSLRKHLWPVLCQKLWHYSDMCINNDYFVNKLSTFVFQNISIVIHCNSILNEILFLILHLCIITWKWQEQGPLFQVRRGPKEFLQLHCLHTKNRYLCCHLKWSLKLSDLNEKWSGSTIFRKILQYKILIKVVFPFSGCFIRTDRERERERRTERFY